jgi:hypothetical protein
MRAQGFVRLALSAVLARRVHPLRHRLRLRLMIGGRYRGTGRHPPKG